MISAMKLGTTQAGMVLAVMESAGATLFAVGLAAGIAAIVSSFRVVGCVAFVRGTELVAMISDGIGCD